MNLDKDKIINYLEGFLEHTRWLYSELLEGRPDYDEDTVRYLTELYTKQMKMAEDDIKRLQETKILEVNLNGVENGRRED